MKQFQNYRFLSDCLIAGLFLNTKKLKKKGKGTFYSRYKKMAWHVHIYFDTLFLIPIN